MTNHTTTTVAKKLEEIAPTIRGLLKHDRLREALLCRLCLCGLTLSECLKLSALELCEKGTFCALSPRFAMLSHNAPIPGLPTSWALHNLVRTYLVRHRIVPEDGVRNLDTDCVVFPSREGGRPITMRSAERALRNATDQARTDRISYQQLRSIGRLWVSVWSSVPPDPRSIVQNPRGDELFSALLRVKGSLQRHCRSQEECEDALQAAAASALQLERDHNRTAEGRLLLTLAVRSVRAERRKSILPVGDLRNLLDYGPRRSIAALDLNPTEAADVLQNLQTMIRRLPREQQQMLLDRYGVGRRKVCTVLEIARKRGVSPDTVRKRVNDALYQLNRMAWHSIDGNRIKPSVFFSSIEQDGGFGDYGS